MKTQTVPHSNIVPIVVYDFRVMAWLIYNAYERVEFELVASQQLAMATPGLPETNPIKLLALLKSNEHPKLTKQWMEVELRIRLQYIKAAWALVINRGPNAVSYQPHVAVVVDDNGIELPYWRKQLFSGYKSSRRQKPDKWRSVAQVGLDYVNHPKASFIYIQHPGYEADDFAGALVKIKRRCQSMLNQGGLVLEEPDLTKILTIANRDIWLYTVDSDWLQLVGNGVTWYNSGPWEPRVRGPQEAIAWAKKRLKVDLTSPEQIVDTKMRQGDKSDDLPPNSPRYLIDLMNIHPNWEIHKVSPATYNKLWMALTTTEVNQNLCHLKKAKSWFASVGIPAPV
jgi:hypothetical protein